MRRCTVYCLSAISKPTVVSGEAPSCTRSCAGPGACDRGMPTTASHLPCTGNTNTRCSPKLARGALAADASRLSRATPPGTSSCCGSSAAAGESAATGESGAPARLTTVPASSPAAQRAAPRSACRAPSARRAFSARRPNGVPAPGTSAFLTARGDPRAQAPAGETRLDLLPGRDRGGIGEQRIALAQRALNAVSPLATLAACPGPLVAH